MEYRGMQQNASKISVKEGAIEFEEENWAG
jgi:hypothetical protein